jgi:hypothetical protein
MLLWGRKKPFSLTEGTERCLPELKDASALLTGSAKAVWRFARDMLRFVGNLQRLCFCRLALFLQTEKKQSK